MEVILPEVMRQKSSRSQMNIRKGKNVVWWTPLESFNGVPPNPIEPLRIHQNYLSLSGNHNTQTIAGCMKYAWFLQPWDKKLISSLDDMEYTSFFKCEWLQILLFRGLLGSGTDNYQHQTPYKPLVHILLLSHGQRNARDKALRIEVCSHAKNDEPPQTLLCLFSTYSLLFVIFPNDWTILSICAWSGPSALWACQ